MQSAGIGPGSGPRGQWEPWHRFPGCYAPMWAGLVPEQPEVMAGTGALRSRDFSDVKLITQLKVSGFHTARRKLEHRDTTE